MASAIAQLILAYLVVIVVLTVAIIAATSDRYRRYFPWLVQDEPQEQTPFTQAMIDKVIK